MNRKIWFNLQRLYYSFKGFTYQGDLNCILTSSSKKFKVGEIIEISGLKSMSFKDGLYRISKVT